MTLVLTYHDGRYIRQHTAIGHSLPQLLRHKRHERMHQPQRLF